MTDVETRLHQLADHADDPVAPPPVEDLFGRVTRLRQRRMAGLGAGAAAIALLLGVLVVAGDDSTRLQTADDPVDSTTTTQDLSPSTTDTTTQSPAGVVDPIPTTSTTAPAAPACRNSYEPSCGAFRWDPAPGANQPVTFRYTITPKEPKAGEKVTIRVVADDPDAALDAGAIRFSFDFNSGMANPGPMDAGCPAYRTRYGPWTPPAKVKGHFEWTFTHVYSQPGSYSWGFTLYSARCEWFGKGVPRGEQQDGGYNPYGSYNSEIATLSVAPADEAPTTTTTESTTTTTAAE